MNNAVVEIGYVAIEMPCSYLLHLMGDGCDSGAYLRTNIEPVYLAIEKL